eukprot:scaffold268018_cov21-Tisochrysis_lutea.AAC.2
MSCSHRPWTTCIHSHQDQTYLVVTLGQYNHGNNWRDLASVHKAQASGGKAHHKHPHCFNGCTPLFLPPFFYEWPPGRKHLLPTPTQ